MYFFEYLVGTLSVFTAIHATGTTKRIRNKIESRLQTFLNKQFAMDTVKHLVLKHDANAHSTKGLQRPMMRGLCPAKDGRFFLPGGCPYKRRVNQQKPFFEHKNIHAMRNAVKEEVTKMTDLWDKAIEMGVKNGTPNKVERDMDKDLYRLMMNIIGRLLFHHDFQAFENDAYVVKLGHLATARANNGFAYSQAQYVLSALIGPTWLERIEHMFSSTDRAFIKEMERFTKERIEETRNYLSGKVKKPDDFVSLLEAMMQGSQPMSEKEIMDEVFTFFFAASESTRAVLNKVINGLIFPNFFGYEESLQRDVISFLTNEEEFYERKLQDKANDSGTSKGDIFQNLVHQILHYVLNNFPPFFGTLRVAPCDITLDDGNVVRKGKQLQVELIEFDKKEAKMKSRAFGSGPRRCPGEKLARKEFAWILEDVLKNYRFSIGDEWLKQKNLNPKPFLFLPIVNADWIGPIKIRHA